MLLVTNRWIRIALGSMAVLILVSIYVFQRTASMNWISAWVSAGPEVSFVINRVFRFVLNDMACLLLIVAIFNDPRYVRMGWMLFWFELLILLPVYFIAKLSLEGASEISSPLLSQVHRMIINPLLMGILITGLLLQKKLMLTSRK